MRYLIGTSMMAALLPSCGSEAGPSRRETAGVTATPAPTPVPAPTPTPTPTPAVSATAGAVVPYVLGQLTYTLPADTPDDKARAIRDAMGFALAHNNVLGAFTGTVPVVYHSSVPTADATYRGQIRFGGSIGRRTALHELAHWLGSGTVREWSTIVVDGRFTGAIATARIRAFDGDKAVLNADRMHFWPYGLNFDNETTDTQRNAQLVSAQIADMTLGEDAAAAIAGTRRFHNRASGMVLQAAAAGAAPIETANSDSGAQQWQVRYADGFIQLVNGRTGLAIAALATGDDAATAMRADGGATDQQWEMMPIGEAGWFRLRNRATGNCLDNLGDLGDGARVRLWSCGGNANQQWQLIR